MESLTKSCSNENLDEIISKCDSIYGEKISTYSFDDNPENVFDELEFKVEDRGNNPKNDTGLSTGYSEFNRLYGGLRDGNVYAIVSRPAQGKTTFINILIWLRNKKPFGNGSDGKNFSMALSMAFQ